MKFVTPERLDEIRAKMSTEITVEDAIAIAESEDYKGFSMVEWAILQLRQPKLCCDFSYLHKSVEFAAGRPVFTHEFAFSERLIAEIEHNLPTPPMEEILGLLPPEKTIVVYTKS
jgi:hypothetical protein